ncbi:hypothetical protein GCM10011487_11960 [Steroidobacter agaridevorans]|uniref:MarR family transcriptional regulator n=1 Tax=Steroidobacter agaridevorans TaxID=2695856 RepID=A0A829Y8V9_9GAMM|nr:MULTISPECIES: hypothetical protein [Steroidobacteraceae]GFE79196.1 hypothetical protein GCM10011487_11960 [Steroidobacter agaridevorans]
MSSRLSNQDADALRLWLSVTASAYAGDGIGLSLPPKPIGLMVLVKLWLESGAPVSYSDLRTALRLEEADKSLGNAIDLLVERGLVAKVKSRSDARARELSLTSEGRSVIGNLIQARHPKTQ